MDRHESLGTSHLSQLKRELHKSSNYGNRGIFRYHFALTFWRWKRLSVHFSFKHIVPMVIKISYKVVFLLALYDLLVSASDGFSVHSTTRNLFTTNNIRYTSNILSESTGNNQKLTVNKTSPWIAFTESSYRRARRVATVIASASAGSSNTNLLQFLVIALLFRLSSTGMQTFCFLGQLSKSALSWYTTQLEMAPFITKSITSGVLGMCGDYMAQWFEYKLTTNVDTTQLCSWKDVLQIHKTYDVRRGLALLADGCIISGPLMHWGYNFFEKLIPTTGAHRCAAALTHVVADSVILDSVFVLTAFIMTGLLEGYRLRGDIWPQIQTDYGPTLRASWVTSLLLMPLEFVCFRFLPVTFRTLAMNITDIIWGTVISFMAHRSRHTSFHHHEQKLSNLDAATTNSNHAFEVAS